MKKILIVFALLAALFTFSALGHAAIRARYTFENDSPTTVVDSSGNSFNGTIVGSGWYNSTSSPAGLFGTHCAGSSVTSNPQPYVSLPAGIFSAGMLGAAGTGSVKVSFLYSGQQNFARPFDYSCFVFWNSSGDPAQRNEIYAYGQNNSACYVAGSLVSAGGAATTGVPAAGRWFSVWMDWAPTGYQVYVYDWQAKKTQLVQNTSTTVNMAAPTVVNIGYDSVAMLYSQPLAFYDNVTFYDSPLGNVQDPDAATANPGFVVHNYGSSQVIGTECSTNSYRTQMFDLAAANGFPLYGSGYYYYAGDGSLNPFNYGVGGQASASALAEFYQDDPVVNHPGSSTSNAYVFFAGPWGGDVTANYTSTTTQANLDSFCNTVWARYPNAGIIIPNINLMPALGADHGVTYNLAAYAEYSALTATGKKVAFCDVSAAVGTDICPGDNTHPDQLGYTDYGTAMYNAVIALLATPTPLPTATRTNTYTASPTPTFTTTSTFTVSPTATFTASASPTPTATRTNTPVCITVGEQTPGPTPVSGWTKCFLKPVTIASQQRLCSVSIFVTQTAGSLMVGIYDTSGYAPHIVAVSSVYAASLGWNLLPLKTRTLSAGNYLIAVEASNAVAISSVLPGSDQVAWSQWGLFKSFINPSNLYRDHSINAIFCIY